MLDTLRKSVTGPFVKILIGILILSFAVWGIQDIFGNFKKTVAIEIDDYEVSLDQLVTEYNNQLSIISSQLDKQISLKESLELGIDEIAIENLIRKMVLQIEINKLGIDISEEFVAEQIINDDNFKTDGKFNKARYEQLLSYAGYNDETYVQSEINVNKQNQLFNIIGNRTYIPNVLIEMVDEFNKTERVIEYIDLPKSKIVVKTPSERELLEFYAKFKNGYKKSETRDFAALILDPENIKKGIQVTRSQINEYFNANLDSFNIPETRELYQFFFNDDETADNFYNDSYQLEFNELLTKYSQSKQQSYLGSVGKDEILDFEVADAAYNMIEGGFGAPIDGMLGISVLYLEKINPGKIPTVDDVAAEIEDEIQTQEAIDLVEMLYFEIEDDLLNGSSIEEASAKHQIETKYFKKIDINGKNIQNDVVDEINHQELIQKIFSSEIGDFIEVHDTESGYIWTDLNLINPPYIKSFAEVRDLVTADMLKKRKNDKESEIIKQLEIGLINNQIQELIDSYQIEIKRSEPFSRLSPIREFSEDFNDRILSANIDEVIIGKSENNVLVGKVVEILPNVQAEPERDQKFINNLDLQMRNDLFEQYLVSLEDNYTVKLYQENIDRLFNTQSQ
jgi:peptidyl-prolyl cis-trans isomerase D